MSAQKEILTGARRPNRWGQAGLGLAIFGLLNLVFADGWPQSIQIVVPFAMTVGSVGGLLVSLVGLWRKPREVAALGVALGVIGVLYLPTIFLGALR